MREQNSNYKTGATKEKKKPLNPLLNQCIHHAISDMSRVTFERPAGQNSSGVLAVSLHWENVPVKENFLN